MPDTIHTILFDSIAHHMIADVPVGIFLSSGLDSTTLTALAVESGIKDLHTVTLGFEEFHGTKMMKRLWLKRLRNIMGQFIGLYG